MAKVMTKCPVTCHAILTGLEVESDAEFHSLLDVAYHVDCPLCGYNHVWFKRDAWIAGPAEVRRQTCRGREIASVGPEFNDGPAVALSSRRPLQQKRSF
jgi:hypothetical protein